MLASFRKVQKMWRPKGLKIDVFDNPTIVLRSTPPLQGTPANIRINLILSETRIIGHLGYIVVADSIRLSSFKFSWWAPKDACVLKQCVMALRSHRRSLTLVPIKSTYAISY